MTDTRALLLTDVIDSTKLSERLGDSAMAALWAAHDRVARDMLAVHRGREIDKTDGFLLLFDDASDAVAYALAYHRAIGALDPPVQARAGLHVGPVILTENSPADIARGAKPLEVDGLAKPTAARIMGLASGGQTLLSEEARAALGKTPLRVESHGHWRMKGVSEPVELFEVGDDDAPFTPPSDGAKIYRVIRDGQHWMPMKQVKHGLPTERDAFVGRSADLKQLARLLDEGAHLVTVLGIGGTGKTRLVTHYGWTWLGDWPGGVWFCDVSEARDMDGIAYAVARGLDVPLGKDEPVVQLGHAIAGRGRCLVLLDNFEQVARHAEDTLGRWLDRASEAAFVVTSREVLGLPGEQALALSPLPRDEAVALFVARAQATKRDFTLSDSDRPHVEALAALLDCLPLAIELAAARVRVMPPQTLLARMSERFKLLTSAGGRRDRQATLRGALDWSWDLLSADRQAALAQLSVFEGGFTLEAAEGVLALDQLWPIDAVQELVDRSLVRPVSDRRFDLLVSVQEYAAERLEASGGRAEAEARHGAWFALLGADEALDALVTHGGVARRRALACELDNVVAACRRSVARGDTGNAAALLRAAWEVLQLTGPAAQALDLAERVAAMPGLSAVARAESHAVRGVAVQLLGRMDEARAEYDAALAIHRENPAGPGRSRRSEGGVLRELARLHHDQGRMDEARAQFEAALAVAREVGDRRLETVVRTHLGALHRQQGRIAEGLAHFDAALAIARDVGDLRSEAVVIGNLGTLQEQQGRMDEGRAHYDATLAIAREIGDRHVEGVALGNLGVVSVAQGRLDEARTRFDAALGVAREVGDRRKEGFWLGNLGWLHRGQGRPDEARAHYDAALAIAREVGDRLTEYRMIGNLGDLHRREGRPDEARAHYDAALAAYRAIGNRLSEAGALGALGILYLEQGRIDEARAVLRDGERLLREIENRSGLAYLLCTRARLQALDGDLGAARATLSEARDLAARVGAGPDSEVARALAEAERALEARA